MQNHQVMKFREIYSAIGVISRTFNVSGDKCSWRRVIISTLRNLLTSTDVLTQTTMDYV